MSSIAGTAGAALRWLAPAQEQRPIAFRQGRIVPLAEFWRHVCAIGADIARSGARADASMLNLCEDRYRFLAAYAAALRAGHRVLLPPSRAEQVVAEVAAAHPGSYRCDDAFVERALREFADGAAGAIEPEQIDAQRTVMIGITSGSTGQPQSYPKQWGSLHATTARNVQAIRAALDVVRARAPGGADSAAPRASSHAAAEAARIWVLATVPAQHMYGMEMSVLLPLIGGMAVHSGRPLFSSDIARALQDLPQPRVLVSTPVHLRSMIESGLAFPETPLIVSATAPLDRALAREVERRLGGVLLELFGSTETCVFASRRTAVEDAWQPYEGVRLEPRTDGTLIDAPWFATPVLLQDVIELRQQGGFTVRGRNTDMIEVAGKRASLADLTRRMLAIDGVRDAVLFQPDRESVATVRRVAALVVAPGMQPREILERLAASVDAAFLPRPLVIVDALPRNEVGKLPRERLLRALRERHA